MKGQVGGLETPWLIRNLGLCLKRQAQVSIGKVVSVLAQVVSVVAGQPETEQPGYV